MRSFASLALFALAAVKGALANPTLLETITGDNFLANFDHQAIADPTHGRVNYVDQNTALSQNLTYAKGNTIILRADYKNKVYFEGPGRNSVRVRSKKTYGHHILVADVRHMPQGKATWPALWTTQESNWPNGGEIDIIEGVNDVSPNQATLHTSSGCTMPGSRTETGIVRQTDCNAAVNGNAGCGVASNNGASYGPAFNSAGGGHYVMQRTSSFIKVWFFPRGTAPSGVASGASEIIPANWGTPFAYFPNNQCNLDSKMAQHNIIINLTLCGDWAGPAFVGYDGATGNTPCQGFVNDAPGEFINAYWDIASLRIYSAE